MHTAQEIALSSEFGLQLHMPVEVDTFSFLYACARVNCMSQMKASYDPVLVPRYSARSINLQSFTQCATHVQSYQPFLPPPFCCSSQRSPSRQQEFRVNLVVHISTPRSMSDAPQATRAARIYTRFITHPIQRLTQSTLHLCWFLDE